MQFADIDIIKWLDDLVALLANGRGHKLEWCKSSGWSGSRVERVLRRYGIRVYCRDYGHGRDTLGCRVRSQQAAWADYLLRRAGCPLLSRPLSGTGAKPGPMPRAWGVPARPVGLAGRIVDMWLRR